jgi:hypothetical protein
MRPGESGQAGGRACDGVATKASASRASLAEVRDNETRFLVRRVRLFVLVRRYLEPPSLPNSIIHKHMY